MAKAYPGAFEGYTLKVKHHKTNIHTGKKRQKCPSTFIQALTSRNRVLSLLLFLPLAWLAVHSPIHSPTHHQPQNSKPQVTESHQSSKADTSGTAKALVKSLGTLVGNVRDPEEVITMIRDREGQVRV